MSLLVSMHLTDAILEGTSKNWLNIDYNSPDLKMLDNLERNAYQFATAKNHDQITRMTRALKDGKGNIRPFADFKAEAAKINKIHNRNWLKTEYNTAVSGANASARWQEYEEDKDVMPWLRYETAGDERVRTDHALLDNVTRRVEDRFWDSYFPPNGFNCRCTTTQHMSGRPTADISYPEVPEMFRVNLGKQQLAFPKGHPYFKGAPKSVIAKADKIRLHSVRKYTLDIAKNALLKKTVVRPDFNRPIGFTTIGLKEAINQPHKLYMNKIRVVPMLDKILERAIYLSSVTYSGLDRNIKAFHYFEFMLNTEKSYIVVRELKTGEMSVYTITDRIKK